MFAHFSGPFYYILFVQIAKDVDVIDEARTLGAKALQVETFVQWQYRNILQLIISSLRTP